MVTGSPSMTLNNRDVVVLESEQDVQVLLPFLVIFRQYHRAHDVDALGGEKHVLGAAQADTLCTQFQRLRGILWVSALARTLRRRYLSAQPSNIWKSSLELASVLGISPSITSPDVPSRVMMSPRRTVTPASVVLALGVVYAERGAAGDSTNAHAARHNCSVGCHPP